MWVTQCVQPDWGYFKWTEQKLRLILKWVTWSNVFQHTEFIYSEVIWLVQHWDVLIDRVVKIRHTVYMLQKYDKFWPWIIFSWITNFYRNLFHRKFVLSELFKWKISSWNIFHIGKFILPMLNLFWYLFHDQQWNLFRNEYYKNNY